MKFNRKIFFNILILLIATNCIITTPSADQPGKFGAVLIAHGAKDHENNQAILTIRDNVAKEVSCYIEVAFLGYTNNQTVVNAINSLLEKEVKQILLVHIAPSSYSYNEQIIAFVKAPTTELNKAYAKPAFKIVSMDDHPLAVETLSRFARELSKNPAEESLMLVGGGPIEELDNVSSLMDLEKIGQTIQNELGFREVVCTNIRTHSPDIIFVRSINELQRSAKRLKEQGRVIVVPYVLQKDFYKELKSYLQGIIPPNDISSDEMLAAPNVENVQKWVLNVIENGFEKAQLKGVNRNWSVMKDAKGQPKDVQKYGFAGN